MSGPKSYTMREMKSIVEYLVQNKLYSETRGRKMWMDFANSSLTTRTWQSLKENFLKRILPDIQNPYYQLTRDQVCSFKQAVDVEAKEKKNRLEILPVSEESRNAENRNEIEQPSTSAEKGNEVEKTSGEEKQSEKIPPRDRLSADTYILDEDNVSISSRDDPEISKKTTEELLAEFEDPTDQTDEKLETECYSEPPAVVRKVLEDFNTDSENSDTEPQMEICEEVFEINNSDASRDSTSNQDIIILEDKNTENGDYIENERITVEGEKEVEIGPTFDHETITEVAKNDWVKDCAQEEEIQKEKNLEADIINPESGMNAEHQNSDVVVHDRSKETEPIVIEYSENLAENPTDKVRSHKETEPIVIEDSESLAEKPTDKVNKISLDNKIKENSLSTTADTIIPNNQEILNTEIIKSQIEPNETQKDDAPKNTTRKRSTSQDKTLSKKKKLDNGIELTTNDKIVEITPPSFNNTEVLFEALKKTNNHDDSTLQDAQVIDESPQNKNPCLKSVSLFEEQFNTTKYTDSEDETPLPLNAEKDINNASTEDTNKIEEPVKDVPKFNQNLVELIHKPQVKKGIAVLEAEVKNSEVIVMKSSSDSDFEQTPVKQRPTERSKCLAQVFGFVPGTSMTASHRRKSLRSRYRRKSQCNSCTLHSNESEEEASITETELTNGYISPPHGRRNKHDKKYRKPQSGRILSGDDNGCVYVVLGNKVKSVIKNGNPLTTTMFNASDSEEDEMNWRQKYIDEKKKTAQLQRQLNMIPAVQKEKATKVSTPRSKSPMLPVSRSPTPTSPAKLAIQNPSEINMNNQQINMKEGDAGKVQISFTKKNEETINVEGRWPQVLPIVQQVISMFYKPDEPGTSKDIDQAKTQKPDISGLSTPIIPIIDTAARKVDDIESEIFKEIEEKDLEDKNQATNVTTRRTLRPKKTRSTSSDQSEKSAKITRKSKKAEQKDEQGQKQIDHKSKVSEPEAAVKRTSIALNEADRSSVESAIGLKNNGKVKTTKETKELLEKKSKLPTETTELQKETEFIKGKVEPANHKGTDKASVKVIETIQPRVTRSRKSGNETDSSANIVTTTLSAKPNNPDDENVRYMFPPAKNTRKSAGNTTPLKSRRNTPIENITLRVSMNNVYDGTNPVSSRSIQLFHTANLNPHEISQDRSRDSVDSTQGYQDSDATPAKVNTTKRKRKVSIIIRKGKQTRKKSLPSTQNTSLDSSNSSYFVPKKSISQSTLDSAVYKTESYQVLMENRKLSMRKLDVINETNRIDDLRHSNAVSKESSDHSNIIVEVGSSSNVSLPLSPEISIVENLSISQDMIQTDNHPTINEMQAQSIVTSLYNQYLIADVDVSVPLMQQDFELLKDQSEVKPKKKPKVKPPKSPIKVSELLSKVTVNTSVNNTLSDTLDRKLRDLLLESAKKIADTDNENLMDVDESQVEPVKTGKKENKRCSTPRKRNGNKKRTKVNVGPVIDEHMESCSHSGGRSSCPPVITFIPIDDNANSSFDVQLNADTPAPKAKKDIIKVKIQRPKKPKLKKNNKDKVMEPAIYASSSKTSVYTDSGINETTSLFGVLQDSVELIHNHSETCLQVNECVGDSIEFVENSNAVSNISLSSTNSLECELVMQDVKKLSGKSRSGVGEKSSEQIFGTPTETVYHSPIASNCSLITEDLSDEAPLPATKWYLLSEDDTTNTNILRPEQMTSNSRVTNFSSHLKQLFPITCTVPDLSTISEMSKENGDSRNSVDAER